MSFFKAIAPSADNSLTQIGLAGWLAWIASRANLHSPEKQTGQTGIDPPVIYSPQIFTSATPLNDPRFCHGAVPPLQQLYVRAIRRLVREWKCFCPH